VLVVFTLVGFVFGLVAFGTFRDGINAAMAGAIAAVIISLLYWIHPNPG
jgi:hypothetical protein